MVAGPNGRRRAGPSTAGSSDGRIRRSRRGHRHLVAHLRQRWELVAAVTTDATELHGIIEIANDVLHQILHALHAALRTGEPRPLPCPATGSLTSTPPGDPALLIELDETLHTALHD